ncbi:hypothetical protein [Pseudomonas sp. ZL2]
MKATVQFILDQNEAPIFAVLPYAEYTRLVENQRTGAEAPLSPSLLSPDGRYIRLPHGGPGAKLDVLAFVKWLEKRSIVNMAINQRAQTLDKFPANQSGTLDPVIRSFFLPQNSPYKNTMQATTDVVDALVETGVFTRIKQSYEYFYRPVNAIEVNWKEAIKFMEKHEK